MMMTLSQVISTSGKNVRRQQDGMFLAQLANQGAGGANLRRIEPGRRFVQNQHRRRGQQSIRQTDALTIALRQGADDLPVHVA